MNDHVFRLTHIGSPYIQSDNDTMDDWYERYKLDPAGIIELDGRMFFRIIDKALVTTEKGTQLLCHVDRRIGNKGGNIFVDENGRRFKYCTTAHMCFRRPIPDWYFEAPEYVLDGMDGIEMGEYLTLESPDEIH